MSDEKGNEIEAKDELPQELREFFGQFDTKPLTENEREKMEEELGDGRLIVFGGFGLFLVCEVFI